MWEGNGACLTIRMAIVPIERKLHFFLAHFNIPENKLFNSVKSQLTYENLPKVWQQPEMK